MRSAVVTAYTLAALVLVSVAGSLYAESTTLNWIAPTERTDGTAYENPAGYRIHYGCTESGVYPESIQIDDPAQTSYVLDGLPEGAVCHFVATAFDTDGIESAFSNEATKSFSLELPGSVLNLEISLMEVTELVISDLSRPYEIGTLAVGELVYTDRDYVFTDIQGLGQRLYIRTANDDKRATDSWSFTLNQSATVYVGHDVRLEGAEWLQSWMPIGRVIETDDTDFEVYSRVYPAGTVELGINDPSGGGSMYLVVVE